MSGVSAETLSKEPSGPPVRQQVKFDLLLQKMNPAGILTWILVFTDIKLMLLT